MHVHFRAVQLKKRYPLQISRGISSGSVNLFVLVEHEGLTGIGECAPGTGHGDSFALEAQTQLTQFLAKIDLAECSILEVYEQGRRVGLALPALAALDIALWDLLAKRAGLPLYEMLGLGLPQVPTSVTIGINPPEVIRERVPEILSRTGAKALKIKLGSPEGVEADQANYEAAREAASPFHVALRVDANGGWSVPCALRMMRWLAERHCDYVEQPLAQGCEKDLPKLFESRSLPIFVDESCHFSQDVPLVASCVDGVNVKLMKTGGITEALRLVATAKAFGLQTMIGCMGESSVAIGAGSALGALFDHIDLDAHLNLDPDPAAGLRMKEGIVKPSGSAGLGVELVRI